MIDERLRRLEREASDPEGRRALARERLRAGDRRGHLAALAALAREGDDPAQRALEALVPVPSRYGWGATRLARCAPLVGEPRVVRGAVELDVAPDDGFLLSAGTLLAVGRAPPGKARNVTAIDAVGFAARWALRAPKARLWTSGLVGDDPLLLFGSTLELRDAADGARRGKLKLPFEPLRVNVAGDRAVVCLRGNTVACLDLTALAIAWTQPVRRVNEAVLGGGRFHVIDYHHGLLALDLAHGARLDLDPEACQRTAHVGAADGAGVILQTQDVTRSVTRFELARDGGVRPVWTHHQEPVALGEDIVLLGSASGEVTAIDRRSGARRFAFAGHCALAEGAVLALDEAGVLSLLDPTSGAARHRIPLGRGFAVTRHHLLLTAIEGGVLVAAAQGTTVHLARVESSAG